MSLKQGKFKPKNYKKYKGDPTTIVYRSGWELKFMNWCDGDRSVVSWSSEEVVIPYKCPTDNKVHRYFPDFWLKIKEPTGTQEYLVEVKPLKQTQQPKPQKRQTKRYITFMTNEKVATGLCIFLSINSENGVIPPARKIHNF